MLSFPGCRALFQTLVSEASRSLHLKTHAGVSGLDGGDELQPDLRGYLELCCTRRAARGRSRARSSRPNRKRRASVPDGGRRRWRNDLRRQGPQVEKSPSRAPESSFQRLRRHRRSSGLLRPTANRGMTPAEISDIQLALCVKQDGRSRAHPDRTRTRGMPFRNYLAGVSAARSDPRTMSDLMLAGSGPSLCARCRREGSFEEDGVVRTLRSAGISQNAFEEVGLFTRPLTAEELSARIHRPFSGDINRKLETRRPPRTEEWKHCARASPFCARSRIRRYEPSDRSPVSRDD